MKAAVTASITVLIALVAMVVNHWWIGVQMARVLAAAGGPAGIGVNLPSRVVFLTRVDHFAQNYGYVLIPVLWIIAFVTSKRPQSGPESG